MMNFYIELLKDSKKINKECLCVLSESVQYSVGVTYLCQPFKALPLLNYSSNISAILDQLAPSEIVPIKHNHSASTQSLEKAEFHIFL